LCNFKKYAIESGLSLFSINNLENIIMNKINWRINPSTVFELADDILKEVLSNEESKVLDNILKTFRDFVLYINSGISLFLFLL
jgi:CCR4-NOT transcriptional regulation complex NOT5 subunit